jgi:hypothetical protein
MPTHGTRNTLTFVAAPQSDSAPAKEREDAVTVLDDMFIAVSENGFVLGRENETPWTRVASGAQAQVAW